MRFSTTCLATCLLTSVASGFLSGSLKKHTAFSTSTLNKLASTTVSSETTNNNDNSVSSSSWTKDANIFEYGSAANPKLNNIPVLIHPPSLHESGDTRIIPFDTSDILGDGGNVACTAPNLMASFLRIVVGDGLDTLVPNATSQAFYVIRGSGKTTYRHEDGKEETISWSTGDMLTVPVTATVMTHVCTTAEEHGGAALYWVHDEPLMDYLGVTPVVKKFEPTLHKKEDMLEKIEEIRHETGDCHMKNRLGVLLGNAKCAQTKTLTHVLWSLLNSIPGNSVQRPHRHSSVALDLCVSTKPGVYTLMGKEIDTDGFIIDPIRCDWASGGVFITPPGWWHSHHNESDDVAWVLPIQDAGLYTHQRTLDIRFVDDELELHRAGRIRGSSFAIDNKDYLEMVAVGAQVDSSVQSTQKNTGLKRTFTTTDGLKSTQIGYKFVQALNASDILSSTNSPEELLAVFKNIDDSTTSSEGGDGMISQAELRKFLEAEGSASLVEDEFQKLFNSIDTDGSGSIDFEEFCRFLVAL